MIINMNGAKAPETPSPVLQEKTVTPQTLPVVIGADEGYTGLSQVTVNPDTNLKAENIRSGKTIFGVDGTFAGNGNKTESEAKVQKFLSCVETVDSISTGDFRAFYGGRQIVGGQIVGGSANEFIIDMNDVANGTPTKVLSSLGWWNYTFGVPNRTPCLLKLKNFNMIGSYGDCILFQGYIGGLDLTESGPKICSVLNAVSVVGNHQLEVPEGITDLGPYTFNNVRGYDSATYDDCPITLTLPTTLTKIYNYSIYIMGNIVFKSENPPEAMSGTPINLFGTSSYTPTITVPKGSLSLYQNVSYLSKYVDYIVEATE